MTRIISFQYSRQAMSRTLSLARWMRMNRLKKIYIQCHTNTINEQNHELFIFMQKKTWKNMLLPFTLFLSSMLLASYKIYFSFSTLSHLCFGVFFYSMRLNFDSFSSVSSFVVYHFSLLTIDWKKYYYWCCWCLRRVLVSHHYEILASFSSALLISSTMKVTRNRSLRFVRDSRWEMR